MKARRLKRLLRYPLLLAALPVVWYASSRLASRWTAVRLAALDGAPSALAGYRGELSSSGSRLRVGSCNIAHGRGSRTGSSWDGGGSEARCRRLHRIARLLRDRDLDIVILNEVDFSCVWSGHVNQAELIAREAGYPFRAEQKSIDLAIPFCELRFGNAVLSRYPLSDVERVDFPAHSRFEDLVAGSHDGILCRAELPGGGKVRILGLHLDYRSTAVRVEAACMILELQRRSSIPLIVAGDFNSTPRDFPGARATPSGENALTMLLEAGFRTLPAAAPAAADFTFPARRPRKVIDWVLAAPPWEVRKRTVLPILLSDHFPVMVELWRPVE